MSQRPSIAHTFRTLRRLPPEVSFAQVEQWVEAEPQGRPMPNRWLPRFLVRYFYPNSKN